MLYMTDILEFVVDGFYQYSFPEHDFVTQVHERVFHVPFYLSDKVYVIHKQRFKQLLADILCRHATREVESMIDIPVHLPKEHV